MPDPKIKAKDLTYDPSLPPFLQRLHAQKAGRGGDPHRHEHAIARPRKAKEQYEDDGPTIVDESGDVIGKEEMEKMAKDGANGNVVKEDGGEAQAKAVVQDGGVERKTDAQKVTDGSVAGASKKRKVAKVVGEEDKDEAEELEANGVEKEKPMKKSKKKSKPIKLAFDDGDDEAVT